LKLAERTAPAVDAHHVHVVERPVEAGACRDLVAGKGIQPASDPYPDYVTVPSSWPLQCQPELTRLRSRGGARPLVKAADPDRSVGFWVHAQVGEPRRPRAATQPGSRVASSHMDLVVSAARSHGSRDYTGACPDSGRCVPNPDTPAVAWECA